MNFRGCTIAFKVNRKKQVHESASYVYRDERKNVTANVCTVSKLADKGESAQAVQMVQR